MTMTDPEPIDPNELRPGPIRHESLSPELLEHVRAVYDVIGPYFDSTLEQFEVGLMRDAAPEDEIASWCSITSVWIDYHERYLGDELLSDEEERKLIAALIAISTGAEDADKLGVSEDVGKKLLELYDALGEESE
jgi:hypothetical protein